MNDPRPCSCGCGAELPNGPNRGTPRKFLSYQHKLAFQRVARRNEEKRVNRKATRARGPSRHAEKVSRFVFMSMVPVEERGDLLRQAAENLGITEEGPLLTSLRACGVREAHA